MWKGPWQYGSFPAAGSTLWTRWLSFLRSNVTSRRCNENRLTRGVVHSQIGCMDFKSSKNSLNFFGFFRIFWILFGFFGFFFLIFLGVRFYDLKKDLNTEIEGLFLKKILGFFFFFRIFWGVVRGYFWVNNPLVLPLSIARQLRAIYRSHSSIFALYPQ